MTSFFITSCSQKDINSANESVIPKDRFEKYDNGNIIIGDSNNAKYAVRYIYKINNIIEKKITLYIDKLPYLNKPFNLCKEYKSFKNLKGVTTQKNNKKPIYKDDSVNCESIINVGTPYKDGKELMIHANIVFLDGFRIKKVGGYDLYLKQTQSINFSNGILLLNKGKNMYSTSSRYQKTEESYWNIKKLN